MLGAVCERGGGGNEERQRERQRETERERQETETDRDRQRQRDRECVCVHVCVCVRACACVRVCCVKGKRGRYTGGRHCTTTQPSDHQREEEAHFVRTQCSSGGSTSLSSGRGTLAVGSGARKEKGTQ